MRAANVWKLSDAIRFSVDYAYREQVEKGMNNGVDGITK